MSSPSSLLLFLLLLLLCSSSNVLIVLLPPPTPNVILKPRNWHHECEHTKLLYPSSITTPLSIICILRTKPVIILLPASPGRQWPPIPPRPVSEITKPEGFMCNGILAEFFLYIGMTSKDACWHFLGIHVWKEVYRVLVNSLGNLWSFSSPTYPPPIPTSTHVCFTKSLLPITSANIPGRPVEVGCEVDNVWRARRRREKRGEGKRKGERREKKKRKWEQRRIEEKDVAGFKTQNPLFLIQQVQLNMNCPIF